MGREFVRIFDDWVHTYDDSVGGRDPEYREVFEGYEEILSAVARCARGPVLEFGTGTGNLLRKLMDRGLHAAGIEPNAAMRQAAAAKHPEAVILDGDFLRYEAPFQPLTFVSSYAFHHLTDDEKSAAVRNYAEELPEGGSVVFADTVFESEEAKAERIRDAEEKGLLNLAEDLRREHYTTIPVMRKIFESAGFAVEFTQLNSYVWLMDAVKFTGARHL